MLYDVIIDENNVYENSSGYHSIEVCGIDDIELKNILNTFSTKGRYDIVVRKHSEVDTATQITD